MAIKETRTLEINDVTAELTNALTDQTGAITSNTRYKYATVRGVPVTQTALQQIENFRYNTDNFTIKQYTSPAGIYGAGVGSLGSTNIIITFKKPVPNFYITAVNDIWLSGRARTNNPLGYIKAYDSNDRIIRGVQPSFAGFLQEEINNGTTTSVNKQGSSDIQETMDNSGNTVFTRISYQFSVESPINLIKKVILEAPPEGSTIVYYENIDWNRPVTQQNLVQQLTQLLQTSGVAVTNVNTQTGTPTGNIGASQTDTSAQNANITNITNIVNSLRNDYNNHTHPIDPNPHIHNITPDPHAHEITPNPHRHGMRFNEAGVIDSRLENSCRIGPEILINLIYNELNTETAGEKSRVSEAAKKGNWITANKLGKPIWDYLENYYIRRVICYLQSRLWYTEYETLTIVPTDLDILPTGLVTNPANANSPNAQVKGPQGTVVLNPIQPPQQSLQRQDVNEVLAQSNINSNNIMSSEELIDFRQRVANMSIETQPTIEVDQQLNRNFSTEFGFNQDNIDTSI